MAQAIPRIVGRRRIHDLASQHLHPDEPIAGLDYETGDARFSSITPSKPQPKVSTEIVFEQLRRLGQDDNLEQAITDGEHGKQRLVVVKSSSHWFYEIVEALDFEYGPRFKSASPDERRGTETYADTAIFTLSSNTETVLFFLKPSDSHAEREISGLVDLTIDLTVIDNAAIEAVVRRKLGDESIRWPRKLNFQRINGRYLEYAIGRSRDAAEVVKLISFLVMTREDRERRAAKEDKDSRRQGGYRDPKNSDRVGKDDSKKGVVEILRPTAPRLENLAGYGAAQQWAVDLAADLTDFKAGRLPWTDIDCGCLLVGPPGTGKTLFATALAASCEIPLIATSYSTWQAVGEGHLGTLTKAIRSTFDVANDLDRCLIFIDEIDTIPPRGAGDGYRDDWWTAVLTTLLECLDGTGRREGVVVVAACNHGNLDPALIRSGRLDRRFDIALPDPTALTAIFQHHAPNLDVDAMPTTNMTGFLTSERGSSFRTAPPRAGTMTPASKMPADLNGVIVEFSGLIRHPRAAASGCREKRKVGVFRQKHRNDCRRGHASTVIEPFSWRCRRFIEADRKIAPRCGGTPPRFFLLFGRRYMSAPSEPLGSKQCIDQVAGDQ